MTGAGRLGVAAYPCRHAGTSFAPAKMAAATSEPARGHESARYSQINMRHEDTCLRRRKSSVACLVRSTAHWQCYMISAMTVHASMGVRRRFEGGGSNIAAHLNARAASATAASRSRQGNVAHISRSCAQQLGFWPDRLHQANLRPAHIRAVRFGRREWVLMQWLAIIGAWATGGMLGKLGRG